MIRKVIICDQCGIEGDYPRNAVMIFDGYRLRWRGHAARQWLVVVAGWKHERRGGKDYCSECLGQ